MIEQFVVILFVVVLFREETLCIVTTAHFTLLKTDYIAQHIRTGTIQTIKTIIK